ncbi:MAG TPA: hypothetical protein VFB54_13375 [Burkholderiales bacterium]|nr:hypothetical protein [Burkholderiales bacterium]
MSILVEAISVVVENVVLRRRYAGGVDGFARDCSNRSFCTDGRISRASFLSWRDTHVFLNVLRAGGLTWEQAAPARDVAVVDQNVGPLQPCLWLEFRQDVDRDISLCWHAAARQGRLHVPMEWDARHRELCRPSPGVPFPRRLRFIRNEEAEDWYQDRRTGEFLRLSPVFVMH